MDTAAILAQEHGGNFRPVAYLSKTLDSVAKGLPACLRAVAAAAIMVQDAERIVLSHPLVVHTNHQQTTQLTLLLQASRC
uniref:Reverse transcriptase RNase H-like domain-containing protein n=1 Tax=Cyprinus carpio carpio TaxID=630221 RepID=A0A9J7XZU4_CYPCA